MDTDKTETVVEEINEDEVEVEEQIAEEETVVEEANNKEDELFKDKYLRLLADFENFKRRSALENLNAKNSGKIEVFRELVDIIDNFERALQHDIQTEEFKKGIEMLNSNLTEKLEKLGLETIDCEGVMNPDYHQAVVVDSLDDYENDEIIEVLQKGYVLEDRLIRAAMVKVNQK